MTQNPDIISIPKIIRNILICSRNLFLVKSIILKNDETACDEISEDPLTNIRIILTASEKINIKHKPQNNSNLLLQTSLTNQYYSPEEINISFSISDEDAKKFGDIFKNINDKKYNKIKKEDIDFAQSKLNKLYDEINIINLN